MEEEIKVVLIWKCTDDMAVTTKDELRECVAEIASVSDGVMAGVLVLELEVVLLICWNALQN